jgi:hypothetical protein
VLTCTGTPGLFDDPEPRPQCVRSISADPVEAGRQIVRVPVEQIGLGV